MKAEMTLVELEGMTVAFLDFVEAIGRPLLLSERLAFRFILIGWESRPTRVAFRKSVPKAKLPYYLNLIEQLREVFVPDPVKQIRLKRDKPEVEAELNDGNYSLKTPLFRGVSVPRLTTREMVERMAMMARFGAGSAMLACELSLARNRDQPEAAAMVLLAHQMAKLNRAFVARCKAKPEIPIEPSSGEIVANMRIMGDLMAPVEEAST